MEKKYDYFKQMLAESVEVLNNLDGKGQFATLNESEEDIDFSGGEGTEAGLDMGAEGGDMGAEGEAPIEGEEEKEELTAEIMKSKLQEIADEYDVELEKVEALTMEALSEVEEEEVGDEAGGPEGEPIDAEGDAGVEEAPIEEPIPESKTKKKVKPVVETKPVKRSVKK